MALVGPVGLGLAVIRATSRIAEQPKAPFIALTVENSARLASAAGDASIAKAMALAERLHGHVERLSGEDLPGEILTYARPTIITQVFVGRTHPKWWREVLRRSLVSELLRRGRWICNSHRQ